MIITHILNVLKAISQEPVLGNFEDKLDNPDKSVNLFDRLLILDTQVDVGQVKI